MAKQSPDENQFIKPAYQKTEFKTQQELAEFMKCVNPISGFLYFLQTHYWIQHPTKGAMVFQPYEYQIDLARNMHENRLSINLLSRQLGKCCSESTLVTIKNPKSGVMYRIPMGEWYKLLKLVATDQTLKSATERQIKLSELITSFKITH